MGLLVNWGSQPIARAPSASQAPDPTKWDIHFSLSLEDIDAAYLWEAGARDGVGIGTKAYHLAFRVLLDPSHNCHRTVEAILQAKDGKIKRIKEQEAQSNANKGIQVVIDFRHLMDTLSGGGIIPGTYKCPNCGTPLKVPEVGNVLICDHCGTAIRAVDIFEKFKSLL